MPPSDWWTDRYHSYLKSQKWKEKRKAVLERDHYVCQACLTYKATEVHHLSYRHIFDEPLFELVSVCRACHQRISESDRNH